MRLPRYSKINVIAAKNTKLAEQKSCCAHPIDDNETLAARKEYHYDVQTKRLHINRAFGGNCHYCVINVDTDAGIE